MLNDAVLTNGTSGVAGDARQQEAVIVNLGRERAERGQPPRAADIAVEIASGARLSELESDWQSLVARADTPNVFMNPLLVKLAADSDPARRCVALLAWDTRLGQRQLIGIWAFAVRRAPQSILPMKVLSAPAMAHGYLATPVIDRDALEVTLTAMLGAIVDDPSLPNI
ncbi:MAG TPA: hypothetical protein VE224_18250, partial [Pseudolabrys sp.]|nr:hypothetical protein [Pseudolabrys sp.]